MNQLGHRDLPFFEARPRIRVVPVYASNPRCRDARKRRSRLANYGLGRMHSSVVVEIRW